MSRYDAIFISNPYSISYLTGFKGLSPDEREAFIVLVKDQMYLLTDPRHETEKLQVSNSKFQALLLTPTVGLFSHLNNIIRNEKIKILAFESEDLRFAEHEALKKKLKLKLVSLKNHFLEQRAIKTSEEISKIKKACQVADQCLLDIVKTIKKGQNEKEIAYRIERWFETQGYESSFFPIVAIDENAAIPHYDTKANGTKKVSDNCTILIDFGAKYRDYCSDETRMIFFGKPSSEILNTYNKLLSAQRATIRQISKLKKTSQIDQFCRRQFRRNNLPNFPHSTGHGIGLEVHELPRISKKSNEKIVANQIFTVEPGVYVPDKFGMRIEDVILINNDLSPVVLTKFSNRPYFI